MEDSRIKNKKIKIAILRQPENGSGRLRERGRRLCSFRR